MQCIECQQKEANKESGLCDECEQQDEQKINGLLYLPAAGLVINLLTTPFGAWNYFSAVFRYFQQGSGITLFGMGGIPVVLIDLVLTFAAGWFFFKRKAGIRKIIIPYYLMGVAYMLYFVGIPAWVFDARLDTADIRNALSPLVGALIWIPYFLRSKRIHRVFIHG
ncbi:DUF2569 domain-containing protein [Enterobacter sp. RHBSTW-00994]|uniref:DUF2569 domain-containing protein n=1 Tax=Enterobacteriaceae TaxID=543 RepID=UPI0015E991A2|nr:MULTISPECIES: DUF2569 domain-containing protein [Enterobacteriaceae]MBM3071395.1 DUF2569 family protein [Lelliottia sp. RWM.1]QLR44213.1 DUF2569 domain-containing protein [Enterobacter sp. RHBSTW-00994]